MGSGTGFVGDISQSVSESSTQGVQLGAFRNGGGHDSSGWAWLALPVVIIGVAWLWFSRKKKD